MAGRLDKWEAQHRRNVAMYERMIDDIYEEAVREAASLCIPLSGVFSPDKPFSFKNYPLIRQRVNNLLESLKNGVEVAIVNGVRSEWTLANDKNDELCRRVFGDNVGRLTEEQYRRYYSNNDKARDAFIARKTSGLGLSDNVWNYTVQFKEEIEMGLDLGLRDGLSADEMSRTLRRYLKYPDKLFRRVRDEHGQLQLSKNAAAFHPGRGVYRSSYKNARRLTATETNMAYRTADYVRHQQLDFVVGIEVHLSGNHPVSDICDDLKGKYPKDFKFTGWHPLCRCYVTTILKTPEEMAEDNRRIMDGGEPMPSNGSVNFVPDVPGKFKEWIDDNEKRIESAKSLPYFMRDNEKYIRPLTITPQARAGADEAQKFNEEMMRAADVPQAKKPRTREEILAAAKERHAARKPERADAIRKDWNDRRATRKYGENILAYMDGISDVDTSALRDALKSGNLETILEEARKLKATGKEILSLSYIDNPMHVARTYSMSEAKAVNEAVKKKLDSWAGLSLEEQKAKLQYEIDLVQKDQKYSTWVVEQNAYKKQLEKTSDALDWEKIGNEFNDIKGFKTKSKPYLGLVEKLHDAINSKDKAAAQQTISDIKKKREELDKKRQKSKESSKTFGESAYTPERKYKAIRCEYEYESQDKFIDKANKVYEKASVEETDAAMRYTKGSGYMNRPLRGYDGGWEKSDFKGIGNVPLDNEDPLGPKDIENLTKLIDKSTYNKDIWLTRGVNDDGLAAFLELETLDEYSINALVGKSFTDTGFVSCGASINTAFYGNTINIYCPKGTKMLYIDGRSAYPTENEMLLQRSTQFRITNIKQEYGMYSIDVEVVGQI